jgi:TolA-binding protein
MKKINKILVIFFLLFITNHAQSEKHNQVSVELDRIKNDIIDLQKFVYKNELSLNNSDDSNDNIELDELKILINDISNSISSLEKQILDIKDDVSNLYSLYTSSDFDEKKIISTSDQLNIEESSSNIVENSEDDQLLGQISLSELEEDKVNTLDNSIVENIEKTSSLSIEKEELDITEIKSISEVNVSMLNDLDQLIKDREIELNKPVVNVEEELKNAKTSFASLNNKSAIESLLLIINSNTDQKELLAETYYLLGRTYFMENKIIEAVKYFGIRHRDFSSFPKFKSENYFWLGKSLFSIGDQENGCLILEDLIFSNTYIESIEVIESAKSLQTEKDCGLIID